MQFNARRIDSLPIAAHDRGWAVYPSGMRLPMNFSFGQREPGRHEDLILWARLAQTKKDWTAKYEL